MREGSKNDDNVETCYHRGKNRTLWIFNFYRLSWIGYGYVDFFLIHIEDLYGFLDWPWVPEMDFYRNMGRLKIHTNP